MTSFPPDFILWFAGFLIGNIGTVVIAYIKIVERLATLEAKVGIVMNRSYQTRNK